MFDAAGRLVGTADIPSKFEPQAFQSGRMFGFFELESGEIAIGALDVPSLGEAETARDTGG